MNGRDAGEAAATGRAGSAGDRLRRLTAVRRRLSGPRVWLVVLAAICAAEILTHTGSRNGFLVSSRPQHSGFDTLPAEGYVTWLQDVPVLADSEGVFTVAAFMLGERGPDGTGILDRRAGYAYLATFAVPWLGPYGGFLALNGVFWWASAAAMYWFVRARWHDEGLARGTSFLVATAHGFLFMAGVPMSYLAAYSALALMLALGQRLGAFAPRTRLGTWLTLGWGAGIVSTLYFTHFVLLIFWWVYGARRVPWRYLAAASIIALGVSAAWEVWGRHLGGLGFQADNSSLVGASVGGWLARLGDSALGLLASLRATTIRGTLIGAFPYPWWALAVIGFTVSSRDDRDWALALAMGGLVPAIALLSILPLPRLAFYVYPAMAVLAARGALCLAAGGVWLAGRLPVSQRVVEKGTAGGVLAAALLLVPAATSNLDLLGEQWVNANFHFSTAFGW